MQEKGTALATLPRAGCARGNWKKSSAWAFGLFGFLARVSGARTALALFVLEDNMI
jgi:hypothetical protein